MPDVVEMQSEAGAAGALHGALQKGSLATTFTASQGLLLMVVPFLHFFDGFRTSHQIDKIALLDDGDVAALVRDADVAAFRPTPLSPHGRDRRPPPHGRGSSAAS